MKRFRRASAAQFDDLRNRAAQSCIRFFDVELPPGSTPASAMIGFEVDQATGSASLHVQRGVRYAGRSYEIAEWLRYGEKVCPSFQALQDWIVNTVCSEFPDTVDVPRTVQRLPASQLTDLAAIAAHCSSATAQVHVSAQQIAQRLSSHICGQVLAMAELSTRVSRHLARIEPHRPLTLMAIGPTGTGKTKTAEALPLVLREIDERGAGYAYLRVDCSELTESHRVSQLLGPPPGYVGHSDGAQLINQLAANPRTIVLFDEIEKAHSDVLKVLLNAIDCGRLSSPVRQANSHTVDARKAIFYFTTNSDSERIIIELQDRNAWDKPHIIDDVCRSKLRSAGFKPELLGRITSFLVFQPLTADVKAEIAALSIARIAGEYGLQVRRIAPETILSILSVANADGFGARPLEFLIDHQLGEVFGWAAASGVLGPLEITGRGPFSCNTMRETPLGVSWNSCDP